MSAFIYLALIPVAIVALLFAASRYADRRAELMVEQALSILTESPEAKSARLSLVPPLNHDAETLALVIGLDALDRSERVIPEQRRGGEFS